MQKYGIWLTYDLNTSEEYNNMYKWLDKQGALECGTNVAYFEFPWDPTDIKTSINNLSKSIETIVKLKKGDRIYIIFPVKVGDVKVWKGRFIFGRRKNPHSWT